MESVDRRTSPEQITNLLFTPPAVESFTNPSLAAKVWPESISDNSVFIEQTENQRAVLKSFLSVAPYLQEPNKLNEAIADGSLDTEVLTECYTKLSNYLESEPAAARIMLYLPFDLLKPELPEESVAEIHTAKQHFQMTFMNSWYKQLSLHDVRANFTDGNVLEQELRNGSDHPRVVKAVHLLPELVAANYISIIDIITIAEESNDSLLKNDIADTLLVLFDLNFVTAEDTQLLQQSKENTLRATGRIINFQAANPEKTAPIANYDLTDIFTQLTEKISKSNNIPNVNTTPARLTWLKQNANHSAINEAARLIENSIESGIIQIDQLSTTGTSYELSALTEAVRMLCIEDKNNYPKFKNWLTETKQSTVTDIYLANIRSKLFNHLASEKILTADEVINFDINIPTLSGTLSKNLEGAQSLLREIKDITSQIEADPYLTRALYPVSLLYGSQLKGYGTTDADIDIAVFIRPDVNRNEAETISKKLATVFNHPKIGGKATQFWLDETEHGLRIHNWNDRTIADGESDWTHVLFGAAWQGDQTTISELHDKLLTSYLHDPKTTTHGRDTRTHWLQELERDTLQYRLMHKGFGRFHPIKSSMNTRNAAAIDGDSAFYDAHYRTIATELYLRRVFLPNLPQ